MAISSLIGAVQQPHWMFSLTKSHYELMYVDKFMAVTGFITCTFFLTWLILHLTVCKLGLQPSPRMKLLLCLE